MDRTGPPSDSRNTYELATGRLLLALPEPADAAMLYRLVGGEDRREVCSTLLWDGPDDISEVAGWIERCSSESFGDWGYHWVVRDRTGTITGTPGSPVGAIGTRPRAAAGRADVGYWLGKPYWGRGLMGEALRELVRFGFEQLDYAKIEADVFAHNLRGRGLVEGAGMGLEGTIRRAYRKYDKWVDLALYGILAEEWRSS